MKFSSGNSRFIYTGSDPAFFPALTQSRQTEETKQKLLPQMNAKHANNSINISYYKNQHILARQSKYTNKMLCAAGANKEIAFIRVHLRQKAFAFRQAS